MNDIQEGRYPDEMSLFHQMIVPNGHDLEQTLLSDLIEWADTVYLSNLCAAQFEVEGDSDTVMDRLHSHVIPARNPVPGLKNFVDNLKRTQKNIGKQCNLGSSSVIYLLSLLHFIPPEASKYSLGQPQAEPIVVIQSGGDKDISDYEYSLLIHESM